MPAILSFGPLFMVIGPNATVANYVGAVMVGVALCAQFIIMSRIADNPASSGETAGHETTGNDGADHAARGSHGTAYHASTAAADRPAHPDGGS